MDARRSQSSTNGRRRRLLTSQDTDDLLAEFQALSRQAPATETPPVTVSGSDRQFLYRMISGQRWKHGLTVVGVVLMSVFAVWCELNQPKVLQELSFSSQPRISKGLSGTFLIIAGQLSLLIGWIRSRSTVDFSGRYRCWKWLSGCLIVIGGLWVTNIQDALPQLAQLIAEPVIGSIGAARRTLVVVPVAALGIWVLSRVVPDMGRNRWAQAVFSLGVLSAIGRLLLSWSATSGSYSSTVLDGVLLSATGLTVISLLLHTRFVLYICNDPPARMIAVAAKVNAGDSANSKLTAEKSASKDKQPDSPDAVETPDVISADWTETGSDGGTSGRRGKKRRRTKRQNRKAA